MTRTHLVASARTSSAPLRLSRETLLRLSGPAGSKDKGKDKGKGQEPPDPTISSPERCLLTDHCDHQPERPKRG